MPSTVIRDWRYDEARNELTIVFTSGKVYVYQLVPPSIGAGMKAAFSKGEYFNAHVRDRYGFRQVEGEPRKSKPAGPSLLDALKASREE
jgi:lysyl-tRNA synthetase class 2